MLRFTLLFLCTFNLQFLSGQTLLYPAQSSDILIRITNEISVDKFLKEVNATQGFDLKIKKRIAVDWGIYLIENSNLKVPKTRILSILNQEAQVISANENRPVQFRNTEPNDPFYSEQWHYEKIGLPQMWDYTTGGQTANGDEIVVAVIDSGFNPNHPDFAGQIYETIDFANQPNAKHGTAVTGFIGAKGNNEEGVTGVNWDIQLLLMSAHFEDEIAEAYLHAYNQRKLYNETNGSEGAFIVAVNGSFGFENLSCQQFPILRDLLDELGSVGILYVGAVPNSDVDINLRGDFPTECPSDYLITVTSTNIDDERSDDAAFGNVTVDLGAPGSGVFTTNQSGSYQIETGGGTSYAAPHVSGAVALLYSVPCEKLATAALNAPAETALLIKEAILNGVDEVPDLQNKVVSNGRLNVFNSMNHVHGYCIAREEEVDFEDTYLYDKGLVRLYPNPADDFIKLDYAVTDFKEVTVKVYDVLGRLMHQEATFPTPFVNQSLTIDIAGWSNGTYFITILGFEKAATMKFVKVQ